MGQHAWRHEALRCVLVLTDLELLLLLLIIEEEALQPAGWAEGSQRRGRARPGLGSSHCVAKLGLSAQRQHFLI